VVEKLVQILTGVKRSTPTIRDSQFDGRVTSSAFNFVYIGQPSERQVKHKGMNERDRKILLKSIKIEIGVLVWFIKQSCFPRSKIDN